MKDREVTVVPTIQLHNYNAYITFNIFENSWEANFLGANNNWGSFAIPLIF